ncbi:MAG: tRNA lysidine(34) synthetase TilS [Legionellaceae bacterium]|nr:tRNA lysidine(34) synthetase TilS [Legionellaceae bacterium]
MADEQSLILESHVIKKLATYNTLYVGFSGGLDSTVLLHQLTRIAELAKKVSAVHVHHGLSCNADAWQLQCQTLCDNLDVSLAISRVKINSDDNLEEQARLARYQVFESVIGENDCLLLAHHRDDQAETLLLQLVRGTGVDGLAAMPFMRKLAKGVLIRPFLQLSRAALEAYAQTHHLSWVCDESNQNLRFSRNFIRHSVLPVLRQKWPNVVNNLTACAHHCQDAKENLEALAEFDLGIGASNEFASGILSLDCLPLTNRARLINVLRFWLKKNNFQLPHAYIFEKLLDEVIFSRPDAMPCVTWGDVSIKRYQRKLYALTEKMLHKLNDQIWMNFPSPLKIDYTISLYAAASEKHGIMIPPGSRVEVRFRRGGERFQWHGQTKTLKKLFQQWGVPPWQRDRIPLIYVNDCLKVVVGFAISDQEDGVEMHNVYKIENSYAATTN